MSVSLSEAKQVFGLQSHLSEKQRNKMALYRFKRK